MKIAFISDSIYPFNKGGKETRSYELATQLAKRKHEVHFYTMKFWKGKDIIKRNGFYLHGICKNYPLYVGKRRSIKQGIMFGLASFKLLKEDFDVLDADHMVYFHLFPAKLACLIKGKSLIVTWHEVWGKEYWFSYIGKKGYFGYLIEKLASKLPNKIIAVSEHTKNKLINTLKAKINVKLKNNLKRILEQPDEDIRID
jgi:glycosyltransferase involved in cell wall biosynthesis